MLTYGGAALSTEVSEVLGRHGVTVACTYGQTELAGPVMFGQPGGDPNVLRPFRGVSYELIRGPGDGEGEGQLVLLGNHSTTRGYLALSSDPKSAAYRENTSGRYNTSDRFVTVEDPLAGQGGTWLRYLCRGDDLLVHTSGEMSNPLPTETAVTGHCASYVGAASMIGTNLPRPLLLVELQRGVEPTDEEMLAVLRQGVDAANALQPAYSRVLPQHVMLLPFDALPKTVKGGVQRAKAEAAFAQEVRDLARGSFGGPTLASHQLHLQGGLAEGGGDGATSYDSLAMPTKDKGSRDCGSSNFEFLSGLRFLVRSRPSDLTLAWCSRRSDVALVWCC